MSKILKKIGKRKKKIFKKFNRNLEFIKKFKKSRRIIRRRQRIKKKGLISLKTFARKKILYIFFKAFYRRSCRRYFKKKKVFLTKSLNNSKYVTVKRQPYPNRIHQPVWAGTIHFKMQKKRRPTNKTILKAFARKKMIMRKVFTSLKKIPASQTLKTITLRKRKHYKLKKKIFKYNNDKCMFNVKDMILKKAHVSKNNLSLSLHYFYFQLLKNFIWKQIISLRVYFKKARRRVKVFKRLLRLLKKKSYRLKRVQGKLKLKKEKKIFKYLAIITKYKKVSYRRQKIIRFLLHLFVKRLLGVNELIDRKIACKQDQRSYFLHKLTLYKTDIKNQYCLALASNPLLFKKILHKHGINILNTIN